MINITEKYKAKIKIYRAFFKILFMELYQQVTTQSHYSK